MWVAPFKVILLYQGYAKIHLTYRDTNTDY